MFFFQLLLLWSIIYHKPDREWMFRWGVQDRSCCCWRLIGVMKSWVLNCSSPRSPRSRRSSEQLDGNLGVAKGGGWLGLARVQTLGPDVTTCDNPISWEPVVWGKEVTHTYNKMVFISARGVTRGQRGLEPTTVSCWRRERHQHTLKFCVKKSWK